MTAKHSPAPFTFEDQHSPANIRAADGDCIAKVYLTERHSKKRDEAHLSNLRLFAAAPELLAALKEMLDENIFGIHHPVRIKAEAAIAKAEA